MSDNLNNFFASLTAIEAVGLIILGIFTLPSSDLVKSIALTVLIDGVLFCYVQLVVLKEIHEVKRELDEHKRKRGGKK